MTVVRLIIAVPASDSPTATAVCASADLRVWFGSVWFRPEQICAVTDSVSEQQRSVCSISIFCNLSLCSLCYLIAKQPKKLFCAKVRLGAGKA